MVTIRKVDIYIKSVLKCLTLLIFVALFIKSKIETHIRQTTEEATMRSQIKAISVIFAATFALGACANNNFSLGSLLGAGAGAAVGSQIGGGAGQLAAVAVGTLAGAIIGAKIEERLNYADRLETERAAQTALELNDIGAAYRWKNEKTGNSGTFKPTRETKTAEGARCRAYVQTVAVDGEEKKVVGVARRNADGSWRIVSKC